MIVALSGRFSGSLLSYLSVLQYSESMRGTEGGSEPEKNKEREREKEGKGREVNQVI